MPGLTVADIAGLLGASVEGNGERVIKGAAALADASPSDLSFVLGKTGLAAASDSKAGCLIVPHVFTAAGDWALIRCDQPRSAFARALHALYPAKQQEPGIHATAVIGRGTQVGAGCHIGSHVSIGADTEIESGCVIKSGCVLGEHVRVGIDTVLHPNVTIYDGVQVGARCIIHAGAVIGGDGFGFNLVDGRYQKFPQVGTVVIEDNVEIGAGCCIDRAALGITRIGSGTKLDNLVHVAHNCVVGKNVVVAAQTGFSGSVTVGDFAVIGGQAGIGEKARIEAGAVVGGKAGILTSATVHAGEPVWGIPARPLRKHLRGLAHVSKLPQLKEEVRQLRQRLRELEGSLKQGGEV